MPLAKHPNPSSSVTSHFSLKGKVAAVTGGARGIGLSASRAIAEADASVATLYSSTNDADAIASQIAADTGANVKAYKASVETKEEIASVLRQISEDFGGLHIVVANAGTVLSDTKSPCLRHREVVHKPTFVTRLTLKPRV
ncbi:hypothetical protein PMIN04_010391 [Paraphaeosphaeria minitans]